MMQLGSVLPDRKCRQCKKKNLESFLEIEGVVVVVRKSKPYPFGGSIYIHRGIFCNMGCLQEYVRKAYKSFKEGKVGGW